MISVQPHKTQTSLFKDFVGQKKLIKTLKIMIHSAKAQEKILDHILLFGPPGLGKTTLAKIIASELKSRIHFSQGSLITKKADLLSLFAGINEGDVIFIDEIHSMNSTVEELLYSAIEYFCIDLPIGVEGESRIMRMKLKKFTLIGATTKINQITTPLKDRFGLIGKIEMYSIKELQKILNKNSKSLGISIDSKATEHIAKNSKYTPRICINLLKRAQDFAVYNEKTLIDLTVVKNTLKNLGIHNLGLNNLQIEYLMCLYRTFNKTWASLDALASVINEERSSIVNNIEGDLLQFQLIDKSPRGRKISQKGVAYLEEHIKINLE